MLNNIFRIVHIAFNAYGQLVTYLQLFFHCPRPTVELNNKQINGRKNKPTEINQIKKFQWKEYIETVPQRTRQSKTGPKIGCASSLKVDK